jgi:hypothetical protein
LISNLEKLYFEDDIVDIRDFILNTKINNSRSFLNFCYKLIEITLKKSIEYGGLHRTFWIEKAGKPVPISEPSAQPIIYNHLRFIAAIKGVMMSREVIASDGSLDFHFSYTKNDTLMKVCVELKNAHHQHLQHGIDTQLPLYIKDVGGREGIFLVLWYKSDIYPNPVKFAEIGDLESYLFENKPKRYLIRPIV